MPRLLPRTGEPGPRRYHVSPGDNINRHVVIEGKACWCNAFLIYQQPSSKDVAYEDEIILHTAKPSPGTVLFS
jgi:hypothetical protein